LKGEKMKYLLLSLTLLFLTSCSLVSTLIDEGDPPIIAELTLNPNGGPAPLLSSVSWKIVGTSKTPVTCTLDFGNGATQTLENCSEISNVFYTYEKNGGFILVLTASVGKHEVRRSIPVTVQASTNTPGGSSAAIAALSVTPDNDTAPMLTAVKWQLTGMKDPVNCELDFGDGEKTTVANCAQVSDTFHTYTKPGGYVLVLKAKDSEREVSKSIPVTVQAAPKP
jgi:PKD repeat protein